ncbi:hypothetical protein VTK26DRAFT_4896 [Humicola hyalothermophila]
MQQVMDTPDGNNLSNPRKRKAEEGFDEKSSPPKRARTDKYDGGRLPAETDTDVASLPNAQEDEDTISKSSTKRKGEEADSEGLPSPKTASTVLRKKRKRDEDDEQHDPKKARIDQGNRDFSTSEAGPSDQDPSPISQFDGAFDESPQRPRDRRHQNIYQEHPFSERILAPTEHIATSPIDEPVCLVSRPPLFPISGVNRIALPFRSRLAPSGSGGVASQANNARFQTGFDRLTNRLPTRYEDGEVRRYGAGESYRPYNRDRSPPPRVRSPLRDRGRSPPGASDSYVPSRSPRRRSRSIDRFRRDRSRDRDVGERWRRSRSRVRSPMRRASPPRRSPIRRTPPRYMSPRRDDRRDDRRDERSDRARSPLRRDYEIRDMRRRSRSPYDRDRLRRDRSPPRRSPPPGPRGGGSYRPRSRSPDRRDRDDRYIGPSYRRPSPPPLPRDSVNSSAIHSRSASGRSSPRPSSIRGRDDRSLPQSPARSHASNAQTPTSTAPPTRDLPKHPAPTAPSAQPAQPAQPAQSAQPSPKPPATDANSTPVKSPPRGPAALRAPPTGPAATRNLSPAAPQAPQGPRHPPQAPSGPSRADNTSPTVPPAGPRGYVPPRGGSFVTRGGPGRSSWSSGPPPRHSVSSSGQSVSPTVPPAGPSGGIPTGPRAQTSSTTTSSVSSTSGPAAAASPSTSGPTASGTAAPKPFNPPTAPAAHHHHHYHHHHHPSRTAGAAVSSLAQGLLNTMPPIIPGGKVDPSAAAPHELDGHHRKLREEEERVREELRAKQDKLRKSLRVWDRLERESRGFELKSELSEKSLGHIAGEGTGGVGY